MHVKVTTYYLEMTAPGDLRPKRLDRDDLQVAQVVEPFPELNRFFYTAVGGDWYWLGRLPWTFEQWSEYLARTNVETWILLVAGLPAGYFELEAGAAGDVEIVYFGLLPRFIGQGLGGFLLTRAVERAWSRGASRVWLHTCSLDHPQALAHYRARGFRLYKQEVESKSLPEQPVGPWPGAK